ncbi:hypothetical protein [Streptomyces sp. H27-C3]|uniref:hypothetical protein n=1 Tax=Streptomyces sp. H27-C3 TaxID=3046305 RepID=UPI0024BACCD7|nr:hypothetical protein [Streptomyces sp. H27-C3]MDJ0465331.1 hypothetical protein [Streptomyces sp. H27-C3]
MAPLRAVGPRLIDDLRQLPYSEGASTYQVPPFPHAYSGTNAPVRELDPAALRAVLELTCPGAPLTHVVDLRQLGGALSHEPAGASAVGNRAARYILRVVSMLVGPDAVAQAREVHDRVTAALAPAATGSSLPFLRRLGAGDRGADPHGLRRGGPPPADRAQNGSRPRQPFPVQPEHFPRHSGGAPQGGVISYLR